jgi:hypothetical protein
LAGTRLVASGASQSLHLFDFDSFYRDIDNLLLGNSDWLDRQSSRFLCEHQQEQEQYQQTWLILFHDLKGGQFACISD